MSEYKVVITKSTVPVGTADKVREAVGAALAGRGSALEFDTVSNPEFLKEGAAVEDFMKPDRVVIGTSSARATEWLRALYEPFTRNRDRMIVMDVRSAELTKYAANAMLATKISFMNELANLAEALRRRHRGGAHRDRLRPAHRLTRSSTREWAMAGPVFPRTSRRCGARRPRWATRKAFSPPWRA